MRRWPLISSAAAVLVAAGCGGSASNTRVVQTPAPPTTTTALVKPPPPKPRPRPPLPPANNGSLPQTSQQPRAGTPAFNAEMAALWAGVKANSVHAALPAFFPAAAYAQVKAISDPRGDWQDRLVGGYAQDLAAAHNLLGGGAGSAQLVEVDVPSQYAHLVPPGSCDNSLSYWEVPNSRVVYRENGELKSFGIASMISWRGYWYVVHLGSVTGGGGTVDDPETGKGTAQASSTC